MGNSLLPSKILVVDADPSVGQRLIAPLGKYGINVLTATDHSSACYLFNQNRFGVVVVETAFQEVPGPVVIQKWRRHDSPDKRATGFILLSGNRNEVKSNQMSLIQELKGIEILSKPVRDLQLLPFLQRANVARNQELKKQEVRVAVKNLAQKGDFAKALNYLKAQIPELGVGGLEMLVKVYEQDSQFEKALQVLDELILKDLSNLSLKNLKGRLLLRSGKSKEAMQLLEQLDSQVPHNLGRMENLIPSYLEQGQLEKAVGKIKEYLKFFPDDPEKKFSMIDTLENMGFSDHAGEICRQFANPMEVVRYYNNRGVIRSRAEDFDGAILEYMRPIIFFPNFKENFRIYYNVALAHVAKKTDKDYDLAVAVLDKCLKLHPNFEKAKKVRDSLIKRQKSAKKVS